MIVLFGTLVGFFCFLYFITFFAWSCAESTKAKHQESYDAALQKARKIVVDVPVQSNQIVEPVNGRYQATYMHENH